MASLIQLFHQICWGHSTQWKPVRRYYSS